MTTQSSAETSGVATALQAVAVLGAVLALGAGLLYGVGVSISVGLGAALATLNLWTIGRTVQGFLYPAGVRLSWAAIALFKMAALFTAVAVLVRCGYARLLPLMLGYAALPLGIVVSQLKSAAPVRGRS